MISADGIRSAGTYEVTTGLDQRILVLIADNEPTNYLLSDSAGGQPAQGIETDGFYTAHVTRVGLPTDDIVEYTVNGAGDNPVKFGDLVGAFPNQPNLLTGRVDPFSEAPTVDLKVELAADIETEPVEQFEIALTGRFAASRLLVDLLDATTPEAQFDSPDIELNEGVGTHNLTVNFSNVDTFAHRNRELFLEIDIVINNGLDLNSEAADVSIITGALSGIKYGIDKIEIPLEIIDDDNYEGDERFEVHLNALGFVDDPNTRRVYPPNSRVIEVTVKDNDEPDLSLSTPTPGNIGEADGPVELNINWNNPPTDEPNTELVLSLELIPDGILLPRHYNFNEAPRIGIDGTTTVEVEINDNPYYELDRQLAIQLAGYRRARIDEELTAPTDDLVVTWTIIDDEELEFNLRPLDRDEASASVEGGQLRLMVLLPNLPPEGTGRDITVDTTVYDAVPTLAGSAADRSDFIAPASRLTIPAGANSAELVIQIIDDTQAELTETVNIRVTDINLGHEETGRYGVKSFAGSAVPITTLFIHDNDQVNFNFPEELPSGSEGDPIAVPINFDRDLPSQYQSAYTFYRDYYESNFEDISGVAMAQLLTPEATQLTRTVNLGFSFEYYGQIYSSLTVHKNGYITLGDTAANLDLEAGNVLQTADAPIIAALLGDTTDYDVTVFGTDRRNGRYIVQWHYEDGDRTIARFQTVLFDSDDTIETRYDIYDPDPTDEDAVFFRGLADGAGGAVNSAADLLDLRSGSRANFRPLYTHALLNLNESDANQFETSFPLSVVSQLARGRGVEPVSVLPLIDGVPERTRSYQLNLELSGDLEQPNPTTQIIVFDDDFDYLTATVSVNPPDVQEGLSTTVRIELGGSFDNFRTSYETRTVITDGYVYISGNSGVQDIDLSEDDLTANNDGNNGVATRSLPFTFTLYGKAYDQVHISENGFIVLANRDGETITPSRENVLDQNLYLTNSFGQDESLALPIIAPFWDDLSYNALWIDTTGVAPNRQYIVEWEAGFRSLEDTTTRSAGREQLTFRLVLEEGSNNIQFHYDTPVRNTPRNRGSAALVGIKGGPGDPILVISDHAVILDFDNLDGTQINILNPDYLVLTIDDPTRINLRTEQFPIFITGEHFTNGVYELELGYETNDEPEQDQQRTLRLIGDPSRTDSPLLENEDTIATFTLRDGVSNVGLELTEQRVREGFDTTLILSLSQPLPSSGNYSPDRGTDPDRISIGGRSGRLNNINSSNKFETVDIGFEFEFYGNTYSSLQVAEDGILVFTEDNLIVDDERDLAGAAYPIIAPFWDDLNLGFGNPEVHTRLRGSAPNRSFIVEWIGLPIVEGEANSRANFQVTLRERSGDVEFYYYGLNGARSDGSAATIGVSNGQGRFAQFEESVSNGTLLTFEAPRLEIALTDPATSEDDLLDSFPIYITPREISDGYRRTITALNDGIPEEIEKHSLQINEHGRLPIVINEARRVVEIEVSDNVPLASLELLTPRTVSEGETATLRVTVDSELRGVNVAYSGGIVSRPLEEIATLPGISEIPFDQFDMGGLSRDENAQNRDIGFNFEFYGEYYSSLAVGIDGFLVFPENTRRYPPY